MSVKIIFKNKIILHLKNSLFDSFYQEIIGIIATKKLCINKITASLLEKMDQDIWGIGSIYVDIADYIKNKDDLINFADIVKKTIEKKEQEGLMIQAVINSLWDFHKELLKYGEELT